MSASREVQGVPVSSSRKGMLERSSSTQAVSSESVSAARYWEEVVDDLNTKIADEQRKWRKIARRTERHADEVDLIWRKPGLEKGMLREAGVVLRKGVPNNKSDTLSFSTYVCPKSLS